MARDRNRWMRHASVDRSTIDYPGTTFFVQAANYRRPPTPRTILYVIIHITGGPSPDEASAVNHFRNGPASAHYIVNREGRIVQMVREQHIANHVDNINSRTNRESIGIEHVNTWMRGNQQHPTEVQYRASAGLVAWLCRRYSIPALHVIQRHAPGIRGHIEEQPSSGHTSCPNPAWAWDQYISLVQQAQVSQAVLSFVDSL